jgi:hypothetical protein
MRIKMLRALMIAVIGLFMTGAAAFAADLPVHSRIGAIFAEPASPPRARVVREKKRDYPESALYRFRIPPPVPGYYGRPNDFYYRPYYEDRSVLSYYFDRLPYACGLYGYC